MTLRGIWTASNVNPCFVGGQHLQMNVWALVACKSDEADFARFLRLHDGFERSTCGENTIRIGISNHFVELEQVDAIRLQPAQ
jgi:hypothetical protein